MAGSASNNLAASGAAADQQAESDGTVTPCAKKDWVEIKLIDADGEPVAEQRVIITLPDGSERPTKTNALGIARVAGFGGQGAADCTISFPDLADVVWKPK